MNNDKHVERTDALTGCANLLSFLEDFSARLASPTDAAFSLLLIDLNNFKAFNDQYGHIRGDAVLHWVGIVLRDTGLPVYRIGGDEFVVAIKAEPSSENTQFGQSIFERLNRESKQFDLGDPPASVILIRFQAEDLTIADLWMAISDALFDAKVFGKRGFLENIYSHAS